MLCAYIASMRTSAIFMMDERRDSKGGRKKEKKGKMGSSFKWPDEPAAGTKK